MKLDVSLDLKWQSNNKIKMLCWKSFDWNLFSIYQQCKKKRNNFVFIILKISCATLWIVNWLLIPSNNKYARIFFYFLQFRLSSTPTMHGKWLWLKRARMSYFWIKRAYASIECRCDLIRCLNCRFFPSFSLSLARSICRLWTTLRCSHISKHAEDCWCLCLHRAYCNDDVSMLCCVWCTFFHIPHFVPLLF